MSAHNSAIHAFLRSEGIEPGTRISNDLMHRIGADWERFREAAETLGFDAAEHRATATNPTEGDEWDYAAHDFILTRNHCGAGFWDGDWHAPWGDRLTELAHSFPQLESYLDDDDILRIL
jgi:hypothetical protein